MYLATANACLIALARSELLGLRHWKVVAFGLNNAKAVAHAPHCADPFRLAVLRP